MELTNQYNDFGAALGEGIGELDHLLAQKMFLGTDSGRTSGLVSFHPALKQAQYEI